MRISTAFGAFAILALTVLLVGVFVLRPTMLIYAVGIFAPAGAVRALEPRGSRFVSLGCATMTFAAAGPVILAGLLDHTRNPIAETTAWIVPMMAGAFGLSVAFASPLIAQILQAPTQVDNFAQLQARQDEWRAAWGDAFDSPEPKA
jgi:hypothetical protein